MCIRDSGKTARVPLYNFDIPILTDDKVAPDQGPGGVMCDTFGASTDAAWSTEHNLPYRRVLLPVGKFAPEVAYISGQRGKAARAELLRRLQAASCDAPGFGRVAVRSAWDIPSWEAQDWQRRFETAPIRVSVRVKVV